MSYLTDFVENAPNLFLIILGWYVVHFFTKQRENEKSKREFLIDLSNELRSSVDKVHEFARDYHLSSTRNRDLELKIIISLRDISEQLKLLKNLKNINLKIDDLYKAHNAFKYSITGKHFEDEYNFSLSETDSILADIVSYAFDLKRKLLELKFLLF